MSTEKVGEKLRKLREEKALPLRKVAAMLDIDVAILSKMERGERKLTKEIVYKLAKIYGHDVDELTVLFLSQKIIDEVGKEDLALKAIQVAEEQVAYFTYAKMNKKSIIKILQNSFNEDTRIKTAWLFGSFARDEQNYKSDIDLMLSFDKKSKVSLFDFADIVNVLEQKTNRRIDLVEEGCLQPFAFETAKKDLIKIYG